MNPRYPSIELLAERARRRMPGFAYDYLSGGCMAEVNLQKNTSDIRAVELRPSYLRDYHGASLKTSLFGREYAMPFGIAPVGLQSLMWPKSCEILARTGRTHNIPFVLSTVTTASIESVAKITDGDFWFQLYHPADESLRDKLLRRAADAGCRTLVLLADTPSFGYRPKEIRNGLSVPPKMTLRNIFQMCTRPAWSFSQLFAGVPQFATLKPYIPAGLSMKHLGLFMNKTFDGRLTESRIRAIRDVANKEIEALRAAGQVGASLQATLRITANAEDAALLRSLGADLKFVTITSAVSVEEGAELAVQVTPSGHQKCGRCWHWRADVGAESDHPDLCGRCVSNLHGAGEDRAVA